MNPAYIVPIGSGLLSAGFMTAEVLRPAHKIEYTEIFLADGIAALSYQFLVVPMAGRGSGPFGAFVARAVHLPHEILGLPLAVRFVVYYLLADLGSYWMHRMMHTKHIWRVHEWHHSPKHLWWLAGVRASVIQQILFNLPYALAAPILAGSPSWILPAGILEGIHHDVRQRGRRV